MSDITPQMLANLPEDVRASLVESGMAAKILSQPESPVQDVEFEEVTDPTPVEDVPEEYTRFKDAPWFEFAQTQRILIVGAGGIGSWTAVLLGKIGTPMVLIDPDNFELHNTAGQLFNMSQMSAYTSKVFAVQRMVADTSRSSRVSSYSMRWEPGRAMEKIVIAAVDNMTTRKKLFMEWKRHVVNCKEGKEKWLFIDGRLAAENYQIITIRGDNPSAMERYEKEFLFSDEEADSTVCSYKQTAFAACMLAGRIVNQFVNFCNNQVSEFPRPIPFFIEYDGTIGYYHTEASCL